MSEENEDVPLDETSDVHDDETPVFEEVEEQMDLSEHVEPVDPLEEAIWFTLFYSCPVEPYDLDWHATIAICINDPGSARVVEAAFRNAREFLDNWPQKD